MNKLANGKKRFGIIRWAIILAVIVDCLAVFSYLVTIAIRYYLFGTASDNVFIWSLTIYQIMGSLCGIIIAAISEILYRRMGKLLNGMNEVSNGNLDVELSLDHSGEYRVMYENFNHMVRELKNADEQQKQFMKDFSHEFKTPIHSIKGVAEYLSENDLPREEEKEYLKLMVKEAGRLAKLSQNTLLLSKLDNMEIIKNKRKFRLDDQIRNCAILMLHQFEEKRIQLNVQLPKIIFWGNEELLQEVWINLLENARKYSPQDSVVSIIGKAIDEHISIEIRDEGQGMDDDTKKHIFDRYYQGDSSHETMGFGLGLSIVKRIVELSNGSITVESKVGEGSTIYIYFK